MGKAIFYERGVKMLVRVEEQCYRARFLGAREKFFVRPQKAQKVPKICIFLQKKGHFSTKKQNRSVTLFSSLLAIV